MSQSENNYKDSPLAIRDASNFVNRAFEVSGKNEPSETTSGERQNTVNKSYEIVRASKSETSLKTESALNNVNRQINNGLHSLTMKQQESDNCKQSNDKSETEQNHNFQPTEQASGEALDLEHNLNTHNTSRRHSRTIHRQSTHLSSFENADSTESESNSPVRYSPASIHAKPDSKLTTEVKLNLNSDESNACQISNSVYKFPNSVFSDSELVNRAQHNVSISDSPFVVNNSSNSELQECRSKTKELTGEPKDVLKSRSAFTISSNGSKRQRQIEIEQVHQVYTQIAPHCDNVKQKAWPKVKRFLKELDPGSLVVDVGCGNGRYLKINPFIFKFGCDLCPPFLEQARVQGNEVMMADNIALPYRDGVFDAVISIGVIHHFASLNRRIQALSELSRILSSGGKLMVYVWAFEQAHRKFGSQDVLIPWVKPEAKDQARRNTISCLSDAGHLRVSDLMQQPATPALRRRRLTERTRRSSSSDSHRSRSRSLSEDDPAVLVNFRDSFVQDGHESQNGGLFNKQSSFNKETENSKDFSGRQVIPAFDNVVNQDGQYHNCNNNSGNEGLKCKSKWKGGLVSECRKLSKNVGNLLGKADSRGNGDAGLSENVAVKTINYLHELHRIEHPGEEIRSENVCFSKQIFHGKPAKEGSMPILWSTVKTLQNDKNRAASLGACGLISETKPLTSEEKSVSFTSGHTINVNLSSNLAHVCSLKNISAKAVTTTRSQDVENNLKTNEKCSSMATATNSVEYSFNCKFVNLNTSDCKSVMESMTSTCRELATIASGRDNLSAVHEQTTENKIGSLMGSDYLPENKNIISTQPQTEASSSSPKKEGAMKTKTPSTNADTTNSDLHREIKPDVITATGGVFNQQIPRQTVSASDVTTMYKRRICHPVSSDSTTVEDGNQLFAIEALKNYDTLANPHLSNTARGYFHEKSSLLHSRSNTSTEVNYPTSERGDSTDCMDSDSNFSITNDSRSQCTTNPHLNAVRVLSGIRPALKQCDHICLNDSTESWSQVAIQNDNVKRYLQDVSKSNMEQLQEAANTNVNDENEVIIKDGVRLKTNFKTLLYKLKNYFHAQSKHEKKSLSCFHSAKSVTDNFVNEGDSDDNGTPNSSFSTHSSCYPGIFAASQKKPNLDKNSTVAVTGDKHEQGSCNEGVALDDTENNTQKSKKNVGLDKEKTEEKVRSLRIDISEDKSSLRQDFVDDVSEKADQNNKTTEKSSPTDPYMFNVVNLTQASARRESLFHSIAKKWSVLFNKDEMSAQKQACAPKASSSLSSSDGTEDALTISLKDNDSSKSDNSESSKGTLRRPTSLDFNKKRTRKKGKRLAPKTDSVTKVTENKTDFKMQNINKIAQDKKLLNISDAMTLLGEGASEESIAKRLDDSAKTVFLQMKRMNFAIRKFPMSSIDSDNNEDPNREKHENVATSSTDTSYERVTPIKPTALKMRRDKLIYASRQRRSDSFGSQDSETRRKRRHVKRQQEINEAESKIGMHLLQQRQYLSEDLKDVKDPFGIQRCKQESHLQFSHSLDVKPAPFKPLQRASKMQKIYDSEPKLIQQRTPSLDNYNTNSIQQEKRLIGIVGSSINRLQTNKEFTKYKSVDECHKRTANKLTKFDSEYRYTAFATGIKRLNGSYQLNDYNKSMSDYFSRQSTFTPSIDQSDYEDKFSPPNISGSSLITSSQSPQKCLTSQSSLMFVSNQSYSTDSSNQNLKSQELKMDQAKSSDVITNNSLCRYYHVFKKGELDQLVTQYVPSLKIVETFYDHANWCIIAEKI